jgi:hypothetical protein
MLLHYGLPLSAYSLPRSLYVSVSVLPLSVLAPALLVLAWVTGIVIRLLSTYRNQLPDRADRGITNFPHYRVYMDPLYKSNNKKKISLRPEFNPIVLDCNRTLVLFPH